MSKKQEVHLQVEVDPIELAMEQFGHFLKKSPKRSMVKQYYSDLNKDGYSDLYPEMLNQVTKNLKSDYINTDPENIIQMIDRLVSDANPPKFKTLYAA